MLGLVIALMRVSKSAVVRGVASGYIQLIQGTPLLILLFLSYFGLGIFGLQAGAAGRRRHLADALRRRLPRRDLARLHRGGAAARSGRPSDCLGLNRVQQYAYVILPQAVRIAIPPTVGFMVQIVKNTSLASVIGFVELDARRPDHQQRDLRAVRDLHLRRRHLLRAVLSAVGGQPHPREEGQCRKVTPSSASKT